MAKQTIKRRYDMRARLTKLMAGLAALAALAFGGASLAGGANSPAPVVPAAPPAASVTQQGDQTTPDTGAAASESSTESSSAESSSESGSESATESADANDGPGGHADEPGNPNADYQFEGQQ
jgi:hypothetical protein